jgi:hypothetical protein
MSTPLLVASILVGILVTCVGIYRAYKQGEFMPLVLGMLILMSCAANYLKRRSGEQDQGDEATDD